MATRTIALAAVLAIIASVVAAAPRLSSPFPGDFNRRAGSRAREPDLSFRDLAAGLTVHWLRSRALRG
jgi:hypothetical protein